MSSESPSLSGAGGPAPTVLVHAGAGPFSAELRDHAEECRQALGDVLERAGRLLQEGADAVSVAAAAVEMLEGCELFNAGVGSALCADGTVEMSAAVMRGSDRAAGGVAGVRTIRHPIRAAEAVLETAQVLMIGSAAETLAIAQGLESAPNETFVTERQRRRLARGGPEDRGTVGAVCLDAHGLLAAATSTGGISGQPRGRVGDSPLPGAGTWADDIVAVSCTGAGEAFIRAAAAHTLAVRVAAGEALAQAATGTLHAVGEVGGTGGLIAIDSGGNIALPFTTEAMPRGAWRAGHGPEIWIA